MAGPSDENCCDRAAESFSTVLQYKQRRRQVGPRVRQEFAARIVFHGVCVYTSITTGASVRRLHVLCAREHGNVQHAYRDRGITRRRYGGHTVFTPTGVTRRRREKRVNNLTVARVDFKRDFDTRRKGGRGGKKRKK